MASQPPSPSPQARVFSVPDTLDQWPWPARINPNIDKVKAALDESIKRFPQIDGKILKIMEQSATELFLSCIYPTMDEGHLNAITGYLTIGWFIEEITKDSVDVQQIQSISDIILSAVRDPHKARPSNEHILGEIAKQWWLMLMGIMTPDSLERLDHALESYLTGNVQQVKESLCPRSKTIEEYLEGRERDVGMLTCVVLMELEAPIPQHVWEHPSLVTARSLMSQLVVTDNDMFSYNKEQAEGDHHNVVHIVMMDLHLSVEDAFRWAEEQHRRLQTKYLRNLASMPSWGPEIDVQVSKYIVGLGSMVSGNVKYSTLSERYWDGQERDGPRDNRVFTLLPCSISITAEGTA